MTILEIARSVEADTLRRRITEAEHRLAHEQQEWDALAEPIRRRVTDNLEMYNTSGLGHYLKEANVARRDLANLPARPVEGIGTGVLKGRLALLESRTDTDASVAAGRDRPSPMSGLEARASEAGVAAPTTIPAVTNGGQP